MSDFILTDADGVIRFRGSAAGGSQPFEHVVVPITFDTDNLTVQAFPITAVGIDPANTLRIAGDHAELFPVTSQFTVIGSTLNDGIYTVQSVSVSGGNTIITTDEAIADATVDGEVLNATSGGATTAGVTVYTPTAGDLWLLSRVATTVNVSAAFNGNTPTGWFALGADDYSTFGGQSGLDLTQIDASLDASGHATQATTSNFGGGDKPARFMDDTPLRFLIDDGSFGAPGSSQGEAEIHLIIAHP